MLTQAIVRELLSYDPETGLLRWRRRDRRWFKREQDWKMWNTRHAGEFAFTALTFGYLKGGILGRHYRAHRIIWLWMTGSWPDPQIDHDNRNRADNRWENLIEATGAMNNRNQSMYRNNTSGHVGIYKHGNRWAAKIGFRKLLRHLGYFDTFAEAVQARRKAERRYGFSSGHGHPRIVAERGEGCVFRNGSLRPGGSKVKTSPGRS